LEVRCLFSSFTPVGGLTGNLHAVARRKLLSIFACNARRHTGYATHVMEGPAVERPMISVVTVTFNSKEFIRGCLDSVAQNAGAMDIEHIVVDNGSKDGTPDIVQCEFPRVVLMQNAVNRGFTAANNQGQQVAHGDYVVFLNPDTLVPAGTFQTMR